MKKVATLLVVFFILLSISLVFAADNNTSSEGTSTKTKIKDAFDCLEEKVDDCRDLTTQEIALTIMATPDNIFDDCVDELQDRESKDNWGNIRDTALAIIALKHAGKDTEDYEEWLLAQNKTPSDLIWYLQQDSNTASECHVGYDSNDYTFNVNEDKKIDKNAGPCLSKAQASFWLQVSSSCYDKTLQIECDKDFISNLIYRNKNSPTIYVLEGTSSAPAFGSVELKVNSKCFGDSSCDYESTAWAALALLETGHNVEEFIPYIIAMSETNEKYLPESFIYILTNYEDYANSLIAAQKLGNYWEAKSTAYSKYYDTGLALLSLSSSSSEQITKAKEWMLFSQGSNGCWQNKILETAMALWALEGRAGRANSGGGNSVTYCSDAGFFCILSSECLGSEDVGDNYFCPSLSDTCCTSENLKMCSENLGKECGAEEVCVGNSKKALDTDSCCVGSCEERPQESECEANFYTCMDSCSEYQEPMSTYSCDLGQVCCKTKSGSGDDSSSMWLWILVILILLVLGAIGYVYREQLKLYWFQIKTKFKKEDGGTPGDSSGSAPFDVPPKPGFPPVRRPRPMLRRPTQMSSTKGFQPTSRRAYDGRDKAMSDTFEKLREMSK